MELSDDKLPFLDILITKSGKKFGRTFNQNQPIQNAMLLAFLITQNPALRIYRLARCICMTVENKNVRYMKLKKLRTILKTQKYPKMVAEKGIEKALVIPQKQLRSEKLKNNNIFTIYIYI